MNETLNIIRDRYSCRDYQDKLPPREHLEAVAEAAIQAPSAMNRQGWRVVLVQDRALMDELEAEGMARLAAMEDKAAYHRIMERGGRLFYGAPCMIVVPVDSALGGAALMDCGILCQNITLAAASLGIASVICGLTGVAFSGPRGAGFAEKLRFPEGYVFGSSVLLGYANTTKPPHTPDPDKIIRIG